ncbi:MAG TPA: urease accessory protein UreD [Flavisolibacter sp.]|nr:urease accessory protein UreD [Flavisolibacter sp.]
MISVLEIETCIKKDRTILKKGFCTQPFKLAAIREEHEQKYLNLVLMSSSPGILDGDEYSFNFHLGKETSLHFETQSFQRLFQMKKGASQKTEIHMEKGSTLQYLPHPVVPHFESKFSGKNLIYLSDNCNLMLGEIITSGRKLNGESFNFSSYQSKTEVFFNNNLIIKENVVLMPAVTNIQRVGQMEGYSHQASLICIIDIPINNLKKEINKQLVSQKDILFGMSQLQVNGLIIRILGNKGEQLYSCLKNICLFISSEMSMNKMA